MSKIQIFAQEAFHCGTNDSIYLENVGERIINQSTNHPCINENSLLPGLVNNNHVYSPWVPEEMALKTVRINYHIMQRSDSSGNFSDNPETILFLQSLTEAMNVDLTNLQAPLFCGASNEPYIQDSRIRIKAEGVYFHQDDDGWNNNVDVTGGTCASNQGILNDYCFDNYKIDEDRVLNIFIIRTKCSSAEFDTQSLEDNILAGSGSGLLGENQSHVIVSAYYDNFLLHPPGEIGSSLNGGAMWVLSPLLIHEIGHCLGLGHSWLPSSENVFTDLPSQNGALSWQDPNAQLVNCCSNNFMSYSKDRNWFSPLQLGLIHQQMSSNWRSKYLCECEYNEENDVFVSQNETWTKARVIGGNLTIPNGVHLIVHCKVGMPQGGKVIIEKGGRLTIDGGMFTNNCGIMWEGIEVRGDENVNQTPLSNQGFLSVINGGCIENAECGVRLAKNNVVNGWDIDWTTTGGVVRATDAIFRNNRKDIEFLSYNNSNANGTYANNRSYFSNCSFVVDRQLNDGSTALVAARVSMYDVEGIRFNKCQFSIEGEGVDVYQHDERNAAIHAELSSFFLSGGCSSSLQVGQECEPSELTAQTLDDLTSDFLPSKISNFTFGIKASSVFEAAPLSIVTTLFENNLIGAKIEGFRGATLKRCKFLYPSVSGSDELNPATGIIGHMGAQFICCTDFDITRNVFQGNGLAQNVEEDIKTGLNIINSGQDANEVYLNDFQGLYSGATIQQTNQHIDNDGGGYNVGLEMICNLFDGTAYDLALTDNGTIAQQQGDIAISSQDFNAPAGNIFEEVHEFDEADWFISQNSYWFGYLHHNPNGSVAKVEPIDIDQSEVWNQVQQVEMSSRMAACPVNSDDIKPVEVVKEKVLERQATLIGLSADLNGTIDGGNTSGLLELLTDPYESDVNIRDVLLTLSPYLSEGVIIACINRAKPLNQWVLAEILLANSPLTIEVLDAYEQALPLSENLDGLLYMHQDGLSDLNVQKAEVKKVNREKNITTTIYNQLSSLKGNDQEGDYSEIKTIFSSDENNKRIKGQFSILFHEGKLTEAEALVDEYVDESQNDRWADLARVMLTLDRCDYLVNTNATEIAQLQSIALNGGLVGNQANIILGIIYGDNRLPDHVIPSSGSSKKRNMIKERILPDDLSLSPNPAHDEFYVTYNLPLQFTNARIDIVDLNGKVVQTFDVTQGYGLLRVVSSDLVSGTYLVSLFIDDEHVVTQKQLIY